MDRDSRSPLWIKGQRLLPGDEVNCLTDPRRSFPSVAPGRRKSVMEERYSQVDGLAIIHHPPRPKVAGLQRCRASPSQCENLNVDRGEYYLSPGRCPPLKRTINFGESFVNRDYVVLRRSGVFLGAENPGYHTRQPLGPEKVSAVGVWYSVEMNEPTASRIPQAVGSREIGRPTIFSGLLVLRTSAPWDSVSQRDYIGQASTPPSHRVMPQGDVPMRRRIELGQGTRGWRSGSRRSVLD